jgi:hypothetical protein
MVKKKTVKARQTSSDEPHHSINNGSVCPVLDCGIPDHCQNEWALL